MKLNGSIKIYKADYIVRGFEQQFGQDYTDIWASVIKSNSYKVLMAKVAAEDLELEQMDVVMAYPHGRLGENDYLCRVTPRILCCSFSFGPIWFKTTTNYRVGPLTVPKLLNDTPRFTKRDPMKKSYRPGPKIAMICY